MTKSLGDILRSFRKRAGKTQEEVAHRAGLERTHVSMIERAVYMPTVKTFCAYCEGVDVRPSEVMARVETELGMSREWPETHPPDKTS